MKLHHVGITVKNIKRSVAWYTAKFNCRTEYISDTWAMLEFPNGGNLALVTNRQHPPHFCIETPDAELYGELVEHRDGTKTTYIKDPDDNVVELLLEET
jgi:catechol 2,3-dioxygenase-like lactoylglutathione lyase family enzyme|tara:strand:- start:2620 stop:2916 length:297 start_codon:yes stop_codon:yes gene_type:complete